jgi:hypothetical protein
MSNEILYLQGLYAGYIVSLLPTLKHNLSVLSSRAKQYWSLQMGKIGYAESVVRIVGRHSKRHVRTLVVILVIIRAWIKSECLPVESPGCVFFFQTSLYIMYLINTVLYGPAAPQSVKASVVSRVNNSTPTHTALSRTPLYEWSARRKLILLRIYLINTAASQFNWYCLVYI